MGLASAVAAVKTHLEAELSNVAVYISANDPDSYFDAVLKTNWPDSTNRLIVLYADVSSPTHQTSNSFRRNHRLSISGYVQDDDTATRGTTLHTLFDDIDGALATISGAVTASDSAPITNLQHPQAGIRIYAMLNYCGGN